MVVICRVDSSFTGSGMWVWGVEAISTPWVRWGCAEAGREGLLLFGGCWGVVVISKFVCLIGGILVK